jgi:hypothetical protein
MDAISRLMKTNADGVVTRLLDESAEVPETTGKVFRASFISRDHREEPDFELIAKMRRKIKNAIEFEFGNRIIDEYVTVLTDCPWLEEKVLSSDETEDVGHNLSIMDDDVVTFVTWEELADKADAYLSKLADDDADDESEIGDDDER